VVFKGRLDRNKHQKPTFHPLGDFLNPALALLGQGLKKSPHKRPRAPMKQYVVGAPWERMAIDILGPLPRSEDGNRYLMTNKS
jgi:hypothetical protein